MAGESHHAFLSLSWCDRSTWNYKRSSKTFFGYRFAKTVFLAVIAKKTSKKVSFDTLCHWQHSWEVTRFKLIFLAYVTSIFWSWWNIYSHSSSDEFADSDGFGLAAKSSRHRAPPQMSVPHTFRRVHVLVQVAFLSNNFSWWSAGWYCITSTYLRAGFW